MSAGVLSQLGVVPGDDGAVAVTHGDGAAVYVVIEGFRNERGQGPASVLPGAPDIWVLKPFLITHVGLADARVEEEAHHPGTR